VIAYLVMAHDVHFALGEDGKGLVEGSKDYFTMSLGDLDLVFTKRVEAA